jgi:hypothetical protein
MAHRTLVVFAAAALLVGAVPVAAGAGKPPLAGGVLGSRDVNGAEVTEQGYVSDVAAVAAYERDFDAVTFGRSRLLYAESRLALFESAAAATVALAATGAVVDPRGSSFRALLAGLVTRFSGLTLKSYSVRRNAPVVLPATEGRALVVRIVTPAGWVDEAYVFMQTGKLVGNLTVMSAPNSALRPADLTRLYGTFARRMRTQLRLLR